MKKLRHKIYKNIEVCDNGDIIGARGEILKPRTDKYGYNNVSIYHDGKRSTKTVHKIIAETFLEKLEHHNQVNHINGIKTDNRVENLEWCDGSHNTIHTYLTQLHETVINPEDIPYIYENPDNLTATQLAEKFGVNRNTIYGIIYDNKWIHITKNLIKNHIKESNQQHKETCVGISPDGVEYIFTNKTKFARENDLNLNYMIKCIHGTGVSHKGWKFKVL